MTTLTTPAATETWPVACLRPHPDNPRGAITADSPGVRELADSIAAQGLLQPLLITANGTVVAGHRRLAALSLLGVEQAAVIVRDLGEVDQLEVMLVENLQRQDLTPTQEGRAYQTLFDRGLHQADIARRCGVPQPRVAARVLLLRLDPELQAMTDRGELPLRHAEQIARIPDAAVQRRIALIVARRQLSAAALKGILQREMAQLGAAWSGRAAAADAADSRAPVPANGRGLSFETPTRAGTAQRPPDRADVAAWLDANAGRSVTLAGVARALNQVCCACGMSGAAGICRECPLPQLIDLLRAEVG